MRPLADRTLLSASQRGGSSRRRRIAILGTRGVPARYGGFETFAEELGVRLVESGVEVTVFCPSRSGPLPLEHRGMQLEYVPEPKLGPAGSLLYDARCLWRARREFDVVYMLGYGASPFCFLPRLFGTRVWINMDGVEWKRAKWRGLARLWLRLTEAVACRAASRLVFDNAAVEREVCARLRPSVPHSVIAYGAPEPDAGARSASASAAQVLERFELQPGGYYLIVARFEPENQIREIIEAFERTSISRRLAIVTNTDRTGDYALATRALESERVRFLGPVYDRAVLTTLREQAHAYVHGHSVGGTNPSLLEAMGCGSLVISHRNPYNCEVLGASALYFDGENELVTRFLACEEIASDLRSLFAQRVRDRARTHYNWDCIAACYLELLEGEGVESEALEASAAATRKKAG